MYFVYYKFGVFLTEDFFSENYFFSSRDDIQKAV